jgi:DNA-binding beta-propeller fold protein YncE
MRRLAAMILLCASGCALLAAQDPKPTEIGGKPFFIKHTWTIGGEGNWDYLTLDPAALQLFVAHGASVQVVDVNAGAQMGQVSGMRDAHGIALDDQGQFGYVSDGPSNDVKVFSRSSLEVVASVSVCGDPRAVVFEPVSQLVFAICLDAVQESKIPRRTGSGQRVSDTFVTSIITVIDAGTHKRLADLLLPGKLGFAQTDGRGVVYVNITDRNQIASFNAQDIASRLRRLAETHPPDGGKSDKQGKTAGSESIVTIDWSDKDQSSQPIPSPVHVFRLGTDCVSPKSLAVDGDHLRLFVACDNQKMEVLNSGTGEVVATLPIGAGTDAIGYDATRGLIYTANGGGLGSLTVIRQNVTDSYNVIQELPTRQRARTLAVNPVSGEVYLVTNLEGFDLNRKGVGGGTHTLPVVRATPVSGSFQVLVVGN